MQWGRQAKLSTAYKPNEKCQETRTFLDVKCQESAVLLERYLGEIVNSTSKKKARNVLHNFFNFLKDTFPLKYKYFNIFIIKKIKKKKL